LKLPRNYLLSDLLSHNVRKNMTLSYGSGETVWMHPPVHRILGWSTRPSNLNLKRNVWKLNQISQIINNEIFVKGEPAISDLNTLNRFPSLLFANLINKNGLKIGSIADFIFDIKTGNILNYLISRSNPRIPGSSRWKLNIESIVDQQPGLVFCTEESLEDLILIRSSIKNEFFKKGKEFFTKFDDIKNIATNKLEDWLEEDTFNESYSSKKNQLPDMDDLTLKNQNKKFNSDAINSNSLNNRDNDPWI
tara:strand:+ start:1046 stop:1792 length:747 start_codon:yes stop_codon:yes gene_type:complete